MSFYWNFHFPVICSTYFLYHSLGLESGVPQILAFPEKGMNFSRSDSTKHSHFHEAVYFEEIHLVEIGFTVVKIWSQTLSNFHCPEKLLKTITNCKVELLTEHGANWMHRAFPLITEVNGSFALHLIHCLRFQSRNPISYIQAFWFEGKKHMSKK